MATSSPHSKPDWLGGVVGILTFLGGITLLLLTFRHAFDLFSIPADQAMQIKRETPVDLARTGESFVGVVGKILLLLVMSVIGSVIANRGIKLYAESRAHPIAPKPPKADPTPHPESSAASV